MRHHITVWLVLGCLFVANCNTSSSIDDDAYECLLRYVNDSGIDVPDGYDFNSNDLTNAVYEGVGVRKYSDTTEYLYSIYVAEIDISGSSFIASSVLVYDEAAIGLGYGRSHLFFSENQKYCSTLDQSLKRMWQHNMMSCKAKIDIACSVR